MSRSLPDPSLDPNPASRWIEWHGARGVLRYYDKATKTNIEIPDGFTFLLLDELSSVRGWHKVSDSGIYANEVRKIQDDILTVRAFKGGELAKGLYRDIKARVKEVGGRFTAHCYVAYKDGGGLALGVMRWRGAALNAWVEFVKLHGRRKLEQDAAIKITGYTEGTNGGVVYRVPVFAVRPVAPDTVTAAYALDGALQEYLARYLARSAGGVVAVPAPADVHPEPAEREPGADDDRVFPEVEGESAQWAEAEYDNTPDDPIVPAAVAAVPADTSYLDSDIPF